MVSKAHLRPYRSDSTVFPVADPFGRVKFFHTDDHAVVDTLSCAECLTSYDLDASAAGCDVAISHFDNRTFGLSPRSLATSPSPHHGAKILGLCWKINSAPLLLGNIMHASKAF